MKKNLILWSNSNKLEETKLLPINKQNIKKIHSIAFSINGAYIIFDNQFLAWIPKTENLYFDSLEYLYKDPIEFNNFSGKKIVKIACNNFVVHAISDEGSVFSWGNDRENYGTLGMGLNYSQNSPCLNLNFSNKKIIDISLSEKHCAALDINRQMYTWGTGKNGELGNGNNTSCNNPILINSFKKFFICKISCGNNYTSGLDYHGRTFYFGKISDENLNNQTNTQEIDNNIAIKYIENIKTQEIFNGKNVISLIDQTGDVFLFNENEGLIKLKIDNKIKTIKFIENNFFALTKENNILYEFTQKINCEFSLNNYFECRFNIDKKFAENFKLFEMPYFTNVCFFLSENSNKIQEKENLKVFQMEKNNKSFRESFNKDSLYEDKINFSNSAEKKINNNYINNINININNSGAKNIMSENINNFNEDFNSIKFNYNSENSNNCNKITKKSLNNFERSNTTLINSSSENPSFLRSHKKSENLFQSKRESFIPENSNSKFDRSNYNSYNPNTNTLALDQNQSINNIIYGNTKTQENFIGNQNNNNKINRIFNYNNNHTNTNPNSLASSINFSESATKLNPLVFPPNNKKHNQLNNTNNTSNISTITNKELSDTSNSQKFINVIKNSNRINRISNLLGRIFNKKLDQIQSKHQNTNTNNNNNNYSSLNNKNSNINYSNSESYFSNPAPVDKRLYDSLSPNYRKRAEIEKIIPEEILLLPKKKLVRNRSEKSKNFNEYIKYEKISTENYIDNYDNYYNDNDKENFNIKELKRSQSDYNIDSGNASLSLLNFKKNNKSCFFDTNILENVSEINIELNKKSEKNNKNIVIKNIDEFIFAEKSLISNKDILSNEIKENKPQLKQEKFIEEKLKISKINSEINLLPTNVNHNSNNYSKNCSNDFRNISNVNLIKEENFNDNFSEDLSYLNNQMIKSVNLCIPSNINNFNILSDRDRDTKEFERNKNISVLENMSINDIGNYNNNSNIDRDEKNSNLINDNYDDNNDNFIYENTENSLNFINNSIETGKFVQSNRNSDKIVNNNNNKIFSNVFNNNIIIKEKVEENVDNKSDISNGNNKNKQNLSNNNGVVKGENNLNNLDKKENFNNNSNNKKSEEFYFNNDSIKIQENLFDNNINNPINEINNNNINCEIYKKKPKSKPKILHKKEEEKIQEYPLINNINNKFDSNNNEIEPIIYSSKRNKSKERNHNNNNNNIFIQENEDIENEEFSNEEEYEEFEEDMSNSFNCNKTSSLNVISEEESKDYETLNINESDEFDFKKSKKDEKKANDNNEIIQKENKLTDSIKENNINNNFDNLLIYQNKNKNKNLNINNFSQKKPTLEKPILIINKAPNNKNIDSIGSIESISDLIEKDKNNDRKLELNDLIAEKKEPKENKKKETNNKIDKETSLLYEDREIPLNNQISSLKITSISRRSRSRSRENRGGSIDKSIKINKNKTKNEIKNPINLQENKLINKILNSNSSPENSLEKVTNNIKIIKDEKENIKKTTHNKSINELTSDIKNLKNEEVNDYNDNIDINNISIININKIQEEAEIKENLETKKIKEKIFIENFLKNNLLNDIINSLFNKENEAKVKNLLENSHVSLKDLQVQEDTIDIEFSLTKQKIEKNEENNLIISKSNNIFYENSYQNPQFEEKEKLLNSPESPNLNLLSTSNFNSISFIEFYNNNNSNSELYLADENKKYQSIEFNSNYTYTIRDKENNSSISNNNFVPEKQIYLQLNSIGPKKILNENENYEFYNFNNENIENNLYDKELNNPFANSNNENYYGNNNEKSQLENITEYIDLENTNSMSEYAKSGNAIDSNNKLIESIGNAAKEKNNKFNLNYKNDNDSNNEDDEINKQIINQNSNEDKILTNPLNNFNSSLINNLNKNKRNSINTTNNYLNSNSNLDINCLSEIKNIEENNNSNNISPNKKEHFTTNESNINSKAKEHIKNLSQNLEHLKKTKSEILEKSKKLQEELALYSPQGIKKNEKKFEEIEEKETSNISIKENNHKIINNSNNYNNYTIPHNDFIKIVEEESIQKSNEKENLNSNKNTIKENLSDKPLENINNNNISDNDNNNDNNDDDSKLNLENKTSTPIKGKRSLSNNIPYFSPSSSHKSNFSNISNYNNRNNIINNQNNSLVISSNDYYSNYSNNINNTENNEFAKRNSFKQDKTFTLINNSLIKQKKRSINEKKNLSEIKIIKAIKSEKSLSNCQLNTLKLTNYNNNRNQSARRSTQINRNNRVNLNNTNTNNNYNNNTMNNFEDNNNSISINNNYANVYNTEISNSNSLKLKEFKNNPNFNSNKMQKILRKIKSKQGEEINPVNNLNYTYNTNPYNQTENCINNNRENDFININESINMNNTINTGNLNSLEQNNKNFIEDFDNDNSNQKKEKEKEKEDNLSFSNKSEFTNKDKENNKENSKFSSIQSNTISGSSNSINQSKSSSKLSFLKIKNVKAIGKDKDKEERLMNSKKKDNNNKNESRLRNTPKYNIGNNSRIKILKEKDKENANKDLLHSTMPLNSDKKNQQSINNNNTINVNNSSDDYINQLIVKQNLNSILEKLPNSLRDFSSMNEVDIASLNTNNNNTNQINSNTSRSINNNINLKGIHTNSQNSINMKRANSKSHLINNNNNQTGNIKFKANNNSHRSIDIKGNKIRYTNTNNKNNNNANSKNLNFKGKKNNNNQEEIHSTSNLVLDKCIENLKTALSDYIKASRTDKNLLKNIIKENFVNIKKENELQKSLNYEREKEREREKLKGENNEEINNNSDSDNANFIYEEKIKENLNENLPNNLDLSPRENNNNNNNTEDIFNENKFKLLSDDPNDIKNFILTELESFKLGLVKDRLDKYFEKMQNETISNKSDNCSSPMRHLVELDEEENRDKHSEYEPIELDRSQMTQMSLNGSLRKSFTNSNYFHDFNSNNNTSNIPSNIPTFRGSGTYRSFNEFINLKPISKSNSNNNNNESNISNISNISNSSSIVLNLDAPLTNNSKGRNRNIDIDDLFEIAENSQEINDLANSLIESNIQDKDKNNNNINDEKINNEAIINIKENGSLSENYNYLNENEKDKEKKFDTYDSLFTNPIPNSNNYKYQFEEYDQNSQFPIEDYLISNKKEKFNNVNNLNNNNINNDLIANNNKIENEGNKKKNTIDILTKEFMKKKVLSTNLKKNDQKIFNLKKAMNTQQKNNY